MNAIIYVVRTRDKEIEPVGIRPIEFFVDSFSGNNSCQQAFLGLVANVSLDSCGQILPNILIAENSKFHFKYVDEDGWIYFGKIMTFNGSFMPITEDCLD